MTTMSGQHAATHAGADPQPEPRTPGGRRPAGAGRRTVRCPESRARRLYGSSCHPTAAATAAPTAGHDVARSPSTRRRGEGDDPDRHPQRHVGQEEGGDRPLAPAAERVEADVAGRGQRGRDHHGHDHRPHAPSEVADGTVARSAPWAAPPPATWWTWARRAPGGAAPATSTAVTGPEVAGPEQHDPRRHHQEQGTELRVVATSRPQPAPRGRDHRMPPRHA